MLYCTYSKSADSILSSKCKRRGRMVLDGDEKDNSRATPQFIEPPFCRSGKRVDCPATWGDSSFFLVIMRELVAMTRTQSHTMINEEEALRVSAVSGLPARGEVSRSGGVCVSRLKV